LRRELSGDGRQMPAAKRLNIATSKCVLFAMV
jgi:hypothetical protein